MTLNWPDLAIGSLLGAILGVIGDWQIGDQIPQVVCTARAD